MTLRTYTEEEKRIHKKWMLKLALVGVLLFVALLWVGLPDFSRDYFWDTGGNIWLWFKSLLVYMLCVDIGWFMLSASVLVEDYPVRQNPGRVIVNPTSSAIKECGFIMIVVGGLLAVVSTCLLLHHYLMG